MEAGPTLQVLNLRPHPDFQELFNRFHLATGARYVQQRSPLPVGVVYPATSVQEDVEDVHMTIECGELERCCAIVRWFLDRCSCVKSCCTIRAWPAIAAVCNAES